MIDRALWLQALEAVTAEEDASASNAVTAQEFRAMFNLGRSAGNARLALLLREGKITKTTRRVRDSLGRLQVQHIYQLVEAGSDPPVESEARPRD